MIPIQDLETTDVNSESEGQLTSTKQFYVLESIPRNVHV